MFFQSNIIKIFNIVSTKLLFQVWLFPDGPDLMTEPEPGLRVHSLLGIGPESFDNANTAAQILLISK